MRPGHYVLIFGGAGIACVLGMMKLTAVADTEPVVQREHDKTVRSEVLVYRVAIAVVIHVVPAEQHLTRRAAVHEYDAGFPLGGFRAARVEQLAVNQRSIGRLERHLLGRGELSLRKF